MQVFKESLVNRSRIRKVEKDVVLQRDEEIVGEIPLIAKDYEDEVNEEYKLIESERSDEFNELYVIASSIYEGDVHRLNLYEILKLVDGNKEKAGKVYQICQAIQLEKQDARLEDEKEFYKDQQRRVQ